MNTPTFSQKRSSSYVISYLLLFVNIVGLGLPAASQEGECIIIIQGREKTRIFAAAEIETEKKSAAAMFWKRYFARAGYSRLPTIG